MYLARILHLSCRILARAKFLHGYFLASILQLVQDVQDVMQEVLVFSCKICRRILEVFSTWVLSKPELSKELIQGQEVYLLVSSKLYMLCYYCMFIFSHVHEQR